MSMLEEFREMVMGLSETNTKRAMGSARLRPKSHWEAAGIEQKNKIGHMASLSLGCRKQVLQIDDLTLIQLGLGGDD